MSTAVRLDNNDLCYVKVMRVLVNAVPAELRRLFKEVWDKKNNGNPWQDDENSGKLLFDNYKPKHFIKRLDDKIKAGRRDDWDMTVLSRVFISYTFFEDKKYSDNVKKLRELKNKYSHSPSTRSRIQDELDADLKIIKSVFNDLGLSEEALNDALNIPEAVDQQQLRDEMIQLKGEIHDRFDQLLSLQGTGAGGGPSDEATSSANTELPEWFERLPVFTRQMRMTEQDLVKICDHLGTNWQLVAVHLGITQPQRDRAQEANRSLFLEMMAVFRLWIQKESRNATREAFMRALFACNETCTIDWDGIKRVMS